MTDTRTSSGSASPATDGTEAIPRQLGELLVETGLITAEQLQVAEAEQAKTGAFLPKLLVQAECITQDDLSTCFVKRCKIPHISLLDYDIGSDVLALVPKEMCLKHGLIPIDKLGRILTIAMVNPLDSGALAVVRESCPELRIKPILCNWAHFEQVSVKYFSDSKAGGNSSNEMSAASLGLGAAPPKPKPAATPPPVAIAPTSTADHGGQGSSSAVDTKALIAAIQVGFQGMAAEMGAHLAIRGTAVKTETPVFPMESFAEVMQSSLREALETALKSVERAPEPVAPVVATAPDWSGLENAFRASINELKEIVRTPAPAPAVSADTSPPPPLPAPPTQVVSSGLEDTLRQISDTLSRQPTPLSGEAMAAAIRDSIGGTMQEVLATVVVQLRANTKAEQPETPSFEAFAEMIRDTLGGALQEMMAALMVQSRAHAPAPADNGAILEPVLAALNASQTTMVTSLHELFTSSQQSQELQGARLAAIAEAAVESSQQTTQLIEATLVQNERVQNLHAGRRASHASVSPFGSEGVDPAIDAAHAEDDARVRDALESEIPLETLTFDTFFPGESNHFTANLCQAVAAKPGSEYNPLFLYGNVGLGKTHLVSAVGNAIKRSNPNHRVGYVSASHFSRRLKEAASADALEAFRDNYCHWDVLILDDIQFMGGRVEAQEEFFHIFNVLHQRGRQIIIASDKAPDRLGLLEQRLISRFASGIVAELKPPEWATRMKILHHHLQASGVALPEEICSLVAMRISSDIRKMVGSLRKIIAFAALSKESISVEMATEILSHIGGEEAA